jgi:hypothetical protein
MPPVSFELIWYGANLLKVDHVEVGFVYRNIFDDGLFAMAAVLEGISLVINSPDF